MDNKEKMRIILPFIVLAICVPIIVDFFIFGNSFHSNISNESWAGFLGSFLGSIIGGGCTCWAVIKQKQYADEQRKLDEVAEIRPYIVAVSPSDVKFGDRLELHFIIQNIGLNSACDIEIYAINLDWKEPKKIIEQIKYEIVEELGVLSESAKGWKKELNLISWNGAEPKYDLRDWAPNHEKMGKGVTLNEEEVKTLYKILGKIAEQ